MFPLYFCVALAIGAFFILKKKQEDVDWRTVIFSGLFAFPIATAVGGQVWQYFRLLPEPFGDFTGGFLAVSGLGKSCEYYGLYTGFFLFLVVFYAFVSLLIPAERKWGSALWKACGYALIPLVIYAVQTITNWDITQLAMVPAVTSILFGIALLAAMNAEDVDEFNVILRRIIAGGVACAFSYLGFVLMIQRVLLLNGPLFANVFPIIALVVLAMVFRTEDHVVGAARFFLFSQIGIPLLFCYCLPPLVLLQNGELYDFEPTPQLALLVTFLVVAGYVALFFNWVRNKHNRFAKNLPFLSILAISAFCVYDGEFFPGMVSDDYHTGEQMLPWYLLRNWGMLPFADYYPARGLLNYLNGALVEFFYRNELSMLSGEVQKLSNIIILAPFLWFFRQAFGSLATVLAGITLFRINHELLTGAMAGGVLMMILLNPRIAEHKVLSMFIFGIGGFAVSLFSLTDGAVMILALLPYGVYVTIQAIQQERGKFIALFITAVGMMAVLFLVEPLGSVIRGVIQLGTVQSGNYTLAHCVPFLRNELLAAMVTDGVFWQIVRWGFLIIAGICGAVMLTLKREGQIEKLRFWGCAVFVLLAVLMIQRAGGRIDAEAHSRIFQISVFFALFAVPFLLLYCRKRTIGKILVLATLCGLYGRLGGLPERVWANTEVIVAPENVVEGAQVGLPHFGKYFAIEPDHLTHLQQIGAGLKAFLGDKREFLDLSHNQTIYAYFGLKPILPYTSYNYIVGTPASTAAAQTIASHAPQLILIQSRSVNFAEGLLPLRSYQIYKEVAQTYIPFEDQNGNIWMARPDQIERINKSPLVKKDSINDKKLLAKAFQDATWDAYPAVFGNSAEVLREKYLTNEQLLTARIQPDRATMRHLGDGRFQVKNGAKFRVPVLSERDGDMLLLRFDRPVLGKNFTIHWENELGDEMRSDVSFWGMSDTFLVPLSAAPGWLLGKEAKYLEVELPPHFSGEIAIEEVALYARQNSVKE